MNPLASNKLARRLLMALAAITSILLIPGCGSSGGTTKTNPVGFTNASLTGTYVFSSQGADAAGYPLNVAGTFVANGTGGSGGITGGTIDVIDPFFDISPNTPPSPAAQSITGGSYTVATDGRGQAVLTSAAYGSYVIDFVLTSTSHGLVTEFDSNGGGSGTLDLQPAVLSLSQLAGPYAFSFAGSDAAYNSFAAAGAFTLNSGGAIPAGAGIEDLNDNGNFASESLTGIATAGSGTAPGSITFPTTSFPNAVFDFYPIDATHWKMIETDYNDFLAGDVYTQTGATTIPTGPMAFTMAGVSSAGSIANGGYMTISGDGVSGTEDTNSNGSYLPQTTFNGTAGAAGAIGGRVVLNLSDFIPASTLVVYPSGGGLQMLEADSLGVTVGAAYAQTNGATITASEPYGLNLSAFNIGNTQQEYEEDDIAQFTTNTSSGFTGALDINDNYANGTSPVLNSGVALTGNYTVDSPATGRGEVTTTAGGNTYVGLNFYSVSTGQFLVLETDSIQIGTGTFESQTVPGSQGGVAQSRAAIVHSVVRPRGALKRK
ncbi:MAG: hypothetical protein WAM89_03470 [Terriglobales bacterium]